MSTRVNYIVGFLAFTFVVLGFFRLLNFGQGLGDLIYFSVISLSGLVCVLTGKFISNNFVKWIVLFFGLCVIIYFILKINHLGRF